MREVRPLSVVVLAFLLLSCGGKSGYFKLEGRFLHMNQSELFLYSLDGTVNGLDTIKVQGGRFAYEMPCESPSVLVMVFPNLSEQPIFATPGGKVEIAADASHLKEMKMEGTKDNELMTKFRLQIANSSPPEIQKHAENFIADHPESPVGVYLVRRYFLQTLEPDYPKAYKLVSTMLEKQPKNGLLVQMKQQLDVLKRVGENAQIQRFSATDVKGNAVSDKSLREGVAIVNVWASWNHESMMMQRQLKTLKRKYGERLKLLGICIDADKKKCEEVLERDTVRWQTVCDGKMVDGELLESLGMMGIPDNILLKDGRVVAHGLDEQTLKERLEALF